MIGGNDATDEAFTIANAYTLWHWVKANGAGGHPLLVAGSRPRLRPGLRLGHLQQLRRGGQLGLHQPLHRDLGL